MLSFERFTTNPNWSPLVYFQWWKSNITKDFLCPSVTVNETWVHHFNMTTLAPSHFSYLVWFEFLEKSCKENLQERRQTQIETVKIKGVTENNQTEEDTKSKTSED